MIPQPLSTDDIRKLAGEMANEIVNRLASQGFAGNVASVSNIGLQRADLSWNCTGPEFTCGDYHCTGTVGCTAIFRCTVSFSGLAQR